MPPSFSPALRRASRIFLLTPVRFYSASTVNPTEIAHFNALAATWWDPQGTSRLLHLMNPMRHDYITRCLASQSVPKKAGHPGRRYLDIGCGGGIFTESAARLPSTSYVLGLDPSKSVVQVARAHARQDPLFTSTQGALEYKNSAIEDLDIPTTQAEQFDVVSVFEVVEHVSIPADFLRRCMRFVRPGGWIVGSTIARSWTSWLTTIVAAEDVLGLVPKGTHNWNQFVEEAELRKWFEQEGWEVAKPIGVLYVPGLGWKEVSGGEQWGNYFFGFRKKDV
ncbi:MAG: Hexaprenyldihydroxybenzoate methyltransferase, mitochondrial [Vezdaea aestivalis]|nr:MAG: Hexaprenyldihydroxybenzoate methyltransferase, mitochondrial [Vezdaea aestivalis]